MRKPISIKKTIKRLFISICILVVIFICYYIVIGKINDAERKNANIFTYHHNDKAAYQIPCIFAGNRFFIKICTTKGDTLMGFGDSGGGRCMLMPPVVSKLGLKDHVEHALWNGILPVKFISVKNIIHDNVALTPLLLRDFIIRTPFRSVREPFLIVPNEDDELKLLMRIIPLDIFLGQNFFMGRSWTFDYLNKQIWVNTPIVEDLQDAVHIQTLGFKKNSTGENIYGHASMYIEVDGEIIEVLFDTGATFVLSEQGKKALNIAEKSIGGSFIAASVFNKWHKEHPSWKCYEKADQEADVIEVPVVKICGYEAGPVLFAKRKDEAWSKWMISSMDTVVRGAIGGSLLKYFKVTVDYNSERIKFEQ